MILVLFDILFIISDIKFCPTKYLSLRLPGTDLQAEASLWDICVWIFHRQ